jgi:cyclopropane-fatty-acyl-phospholipid synthase
MSSGAYRAKVERLLASADVRIDGDRPWDIRVHDERLYRRVLLEGALGAGESYMDGWWDVPRLDEFFARLFRARVDDHLQSRTWFLRALRALLFNLQTPSRAFTVGRRHYDIGNRLYQCMLGERMIYSCAYWEAAATLDEAQEAKLELVCRKLGLRPGMRVLDIGCGWGGAARFAAERYGVRVVGITVSEAQAAYAQSRCRGLPVEIRLQDYRALAEPFDRILSIGMFEHVGCKNYGTFMRTVRACLPDDGLFLLHTIGRNESANRTDAWTERYVFPNSMLPSVTQIGAAIEGRFVLEDWHSFGPDYDRTLMAWHENFRAHWDELRAEYDERFYRMWTYYLLCSAGAFRARGNQLWQILLSPCGAPGGFRMPRHAVPLQG